MSKTLVSPTTWWLGGNLTVNGDVTSNLNPGGNHQLGNGSSRWDYGYFKNLDVSESLKLTGTVISNFVPDGGARNLGSSSARWTNVFSAQLNSNGVATLSGDINSSGKFSNHAIPKVNNTYDLGASTLSWRKLWLVNGDVSGQVKAPAASSPTNGNYLVNKNYVDTAIGNLAGLWTQTASTIYVTALNRSLVKNGVASLGTTASRWDTAYIAGTNTETLVVTTAVNSDLIPNGTLTLGNSSAPWNHVHTTKVTANSYSGGIVRGDLLPDANDAHNLGTVHNRWANVYTNDLHLANERGDWTIIEEEEYLSIKNNKNGKMYKFVLEEIG